MPTGDEDQTAQVASQMSMTASDSWEEGPAFESERHKDPRKRSIPVEEWVLDLKVSSLLEEAPNPENHTRPSNSTIVGSC